MSAYPQSIPAVRDALLAWTPHPIIADAVNAAQTHPSPVVQVVQVFEALKDRIGVSEPPAEGEEATLVLDRAGLELLAGCAHLIAENAWHGKGGAALTTLLAATAALNALPPEEPPAPSPEGGE